MRSLILLIAAARCLYAAPTLRLTNSVVGPISIAVGERAPDQSLGAYNIGDETLSLTLSIPASIHWLSASVGASQPCPLSPYTCTELRFTPNTAALPAGSYTAAVTISDLRAVDSPQIVTVTVLVGNALPAIDLEMTPGTTADFRSLINSAWCPRGCGTPGATVKNAGQWLTASVVLDAATSISISWHWQIRLAPPVAMPPGTYTGTVSLASDRIPVTMRLSPLTSPAASPNRVNLRLAQDGPPITAPFLSPIALLGPGSTLIPAQSVTTTGKGISASISSGTVVITVDPAGLAPGVYNAGRIAIACSLAGCPVTVPVDLEIVIPGPPQLATQGLVDNATFSPNLPAAPGDVMILRGEQLSRSPAAFASRTPLPMSLGGVTVTVNGVGAPLYYSSSGQVCFQIPYSITTGTSQIQLFRDGQPSSLVPITVVPRAPQIVVITAADYSLRDATHPAHPGESLILWAIGLGQTTPPAIAGAPAPSDPFAAVAPLPLVNLGDTSLPASFAGLAPGLVGLYQVNFTVPSDTPPGVVPLTLGFRFDYFSEAVSLAIQ